MIFWPSCDVTKHYKGLFNIDDGSSVLGMKFIGGVVSRDRGFMKGLPMKKANMDVELICLFP